jgi:hypothetical protein
MEEDEKQSNLKVTERQTPSDGIYDDCDSLNRTQQNHGELFHY